MGPIRYIVYLFPILTIAALLGFFLWYWQTMRAPLAQQIAPMPEKKPFTFAGRCHPLVKKDAIPMVLITIAYAVTAFFNLGSTTAPQHPWDFGDEKEATFVLSEEYLVSKLWYFSGLGTGKYQVEISSDGVNWLSLWQRKDNADDPDEITGYYWADGTGYGASYAMTQNYNQLFKWNEIIFDNPQYIRYIRITGQANKGLLELNELALFDESGARIWISDSTNPLFDEADTVPETISFENSAYFDEIYHPRTAYEHLRNIEPYEISHPPLGKLIMSIGIALFGMTPFGWRFMGTLFGVAMIPLLYLFLKNVFGRTSIATCGTILLAVDFMHLTQTRLATIDTYAFFFILLMYYFMYRYLTLPDGATFKQCALPLFLSGLFWGIGAASKWTVIYGCTGLVALYFIGLVVKLRRWPEESRHERLGWTVKILAFSVLVFAIIPAIIYVLSYLPYASASGDLSLENLLKEMWENQKYMLTYHQGVTASHPYSSRWYQWLVNARPILYYMDNSVSGVTTRFAAFLNPVVCWGGLAAMLMCAAQAFRTLWAKLTFFLVSGLGAAASAAWVTGVFDGETDPQTRLLSLLLIAACLILYLMLGWFASRAFQQSSPIALFILIGYLAQLVPWFFIGRITFAYHYFPSVLFLILALCYVFHTLSQKEGMIRWKPAMYAVTGGAAALYALFYPVLVGITYPTWYGTCILKWFPAWPF